MNGKLWRPCPICDEQHYVTRRWKMCERCRLRLRAGMERLKKELQDKLFQRRLNRVLAGL